MKVNYESHTFEVPAWAKYLAADNDGHVFAYSHTPTRLEAQGVWTKQLDTKQQFVGSIPLYPIMEISDEEEETDASPKETGAGMAIRSFKTSEATGARREGERRSTKTSRIEAEVQDRTVLVTDDAFIKYFDVQQDA